MDEIKSKRITEIEEQLRSGSINALEIFWKEIYKKGAPLVEELEGEAENALVTFLYKAEREMDNILIFGEAVGLDYTKNKMSQLLNTDLWYKTYKFPKDIEITYWFVENDAQDEDFAKRHEKCIIDPLNPKKFVMKDDEEDPAGKDYEVSYIKMPDVKSKVWIVERDRVEKGRLDKYIFKSEVLSNERRIWVYTPKGYTSEKDHNLLVLTDGNAYVKWLSAETVLDNLIQDELIPPTVVVFIDAGKDRFKELSLNEDFSTFVVDELLHFVHSKYNVTNCPERVTIGGISLGGLNAAYMGYIHSEVFGNVLSQSGSFYWSPLEGEEKNKLIRMYRESSKLPLRFFITYGVLEHSRKREFSIVDRNIEFIEILKNNGYEVYSHEFKSGHDYLNWGEALGEGLLALFGKKLD